MSSKQLNSENIAIEFNKVSKVYTDRDGLLSVKRYLDRLKNFQMKKAAPIPGFVALEDISFIVKKGEKVGFIGRNGAGKSTTLRLAAGIASPSKGQITINGKIGGVLELGSGFNGEFTARDNIYVQGSMYGYKKEEIDSMIPEVMRIAELSDFIDVPLKKYSSGMRVRLGFATALTASPEIVLLDEVLAVGDATFKERATKLMHEFLANKTLFFVSHSMPQICKVCDRVIVLEKGKISFDGPAKEGSEYYLEHIVGAKKENKEKKYISRNLKRGTASLASFKIEDIFFTKTKQNNRHTFQCGDGVSVSISIHNPERKKLALRIDLSKLVLNELSNNILIKREAVPSDPEVKLEYTVDSSLLTAGEYKLMSQIDDSELKQSREMLIIETLYFTVESPSDESEMGLIKLPCFIKVVENNTKTKVSQDQ